MVLWGYRGSMGVYLSIMMAGEYLVSSYVPEVVSCLGVRPVEYWCNSRYHSDTLSRATQRLRAGIQGFLCPCQGVELVSVASAAADTPAQVIAQTPCTTPSRY